MNSKKKVNINVITDSSFNNTEDARSICGWITCFAGNEKSAKTKKQSNIALSSTEAEYISITMAVQELLWLMNILEELKIKFNTPTIYSDNQPAIKISQSAAIKGRTRHINVKLQFVKELLKENKIILKYVETEENIADLFTKALPEKRFKKFIKNYEERLNCFKNYYENN